MPAKCQARTESRSHHGGTALISFELTEEQKLAQSMVQELAGSQLRPAARDADDREAIPSSILDEIWATGIVQSQADADQLAQPR